MHAEPHGAQFPAARVIYTIGHSNHPPGTFLRLLQQHHIDVLVDVRSSPYSKYAPHFNRNALGTALNSHQILYVFLGDELGGRPRTHKPDGHKEDPDYGAIEHAPEFQAGIERLVHWDPRQRVAILCGEENPGQCHRRFLVGKALQHHGVTVLHIRGDGRVQTEEELVLEINRGQGELFGL
jgi:uncharacterized protein (DUF488 family)